MPIKKLPTNLAKLSKPNTYSRTAWPNARHLFLPSGFFLLLSASFSHPVIIKLMPCELSQLLSNRHMHCLIVSATAGKTIWFTESAHQADEFIEKENPLDNHMAKKKTRTRLSHQMKLGISIETCDMLQHLHQIHRQVRNTSEKLTVQVDLGQLLLINRSLGY